MATLHAAHGLGSPLKMVETVIEVADVAWNAYEHRRHRHEHDGSDEDLCRLREENRRLRDLLADNLSFLRGISEFPSFTKDCPPDLHERLVKAVNSTNFLNHLKALSDETLNPLPHGSFPFEKIDGKDSTISDIVIDLDGEPSFWIWVTDDMVPSMVYEPCSMDNDSYVIIDEDHVVDGIGYFMARCIIANPKSKSLTPEELQKTVGKALGEMNDWLKLKKAWHAGKLLYSLSTWGVALAGLYTHRGLVKAAAKGVGATGKLLLKVI